MKKTTIAIAATLLTLGIGITAQAGYPSFDVSDIEIVYGTDTVLDYPHNQVCDTVAIKNNSDFDMVHYRMYFAPVDDNYKYDNNDVVFIESFDLIEPGDTGLSNKALDWYSEPVDDFNKYSLVSIEWDYVYKDYKHSVIHDFSNDKSAEKSVEPLDTADKLTDEELYMVCPEGKYVWRDTGYGDNSDYIGYYIWDIDDSDMQIFVDYYESLGWTADSDYGSDDGRYHIIQYSNNNVGYAYIYRQGNYIHVSMNYYD